jgi:hypothetical protein
MVRLIGLLVLLLLVATTASAADAHRAAAAKHTPAAAAPHDPRVTGPVLSADDRWTAKVLTGIGVMFAAAILIGPAYRAHLPEEIPLTHSHDEPPGPSGLHGKTGAVDPTAPDHHRH